MRFCSFVLIGWWSDSHIELYIITLKNKVAKTRISSGSYNDDSKDTYNNDTDNRDTNDGNDKDAKDNSNSDVDKLSISVVKMIMITKIVVSTMTL